MSSAIWDDLFERATEHAVGVDKIREALAARRRRERAADEGGDRSVSTGDSSVDDASAEPSAETNQSAGFDPETRAARVVADADVLAADLLVGDTDNSARDAMDLVRSHSWLILLASEPLRDDAEAVVAELADPDLAADWRAAVDSLATSVPQTGGDHPALASALHGDAAHVLSFDESLQGVRAGVALRQHVEASVRDPAAFVLVFDAESLYEAVEGGRYPEPDRDPRG